LITNNFKKQKLVLLILHYENQIIVKSVHKIKRDQKNWKIDSNY